MLKNYLKVAVRSLLKNKSFSIINVFGLAISMSVCIVVIMLIADQVSYDRYNSKADKIYRINTERDDTNDLINIFATAPLPLADKLQSEYSSVKNAVRIRRGFGNSWIGIGDDVNIPIGGFFVDPSFLDVFEYELEYGNPEVALSTPNSVVLTKKAAEKLFDVENPVGEFIKVGELGEYKVTGVLRPLSGKSHIVFEALASMSSVTNLEADSTLSSTLNEWKNSTSGWVYLELNEKSTSSQVEQEIAEINKEIYANMEDRNYRFYLQGITAITPGPLLGNQIGPGLPYVFVYFLAGLALIIMLSACFNYTNLTIARSLTRAKEIGIRKVSGAFKRQIFSQFIWEAIVISLAALFFSFVFLIGLKPAFENLQFASLLNWKLDSTPMAYVASLVFSIAVGLSAGLFPAIMLSSFKPISVLGGLSNVKLFSKTGLRKALIVAQFTLSLVFIISTTLVYQQLDYMLGANYGFNKENILNVRLNNAPFESLKTELDNYSSVKNVAISSHIPASGITYNADTKLDLNNEESIDLAYFAVDEGYIENMGLTLLAGKNFEPQSQENAEKYVILNNTAIDEFDLISPKDAIGELIYVDDSIALQIIGIVADYNHQTMMSTIAPMALRYFPERFSLIQVAYSTGSRNQAMADVKTAWDKINPTYKLDIKDFDEELKSFYQLTFGDLVSVVGFIAFIAIIVSCLGLLGMATYTTETRLKEVCIRKVLGAPNDRIAVLLSKGFLVLLLVAVVLAVPLSYFLNSLWLNNIAYRVEISPVTILSSTLIILILGVLTIGSQVMKAAIANPVENLKMD
ncbi:MAG: ABC transporter permease [Bacteroidota bacterium]